MSIATSVNRLFDHPSVRNCVSEAAAFPTTSVIPAQAGIPLLFAGRVAGLMRGQGSGAPDQVRGDEDFMMEALSKHVIQRP